MKNDVARQILQDFAADAERGEGGLTEALLDARHALLDARHALLDARHALAQHRRVRPGVLYRIGPPGSMREYDPARFPPALLRTVQIGAGEFEQQQFPRYHFEEPEDWGYGWFIYALSYSEATQLATSATTTRCTTDGDIIE